MRTSNSPFHHLTISFRAQVGHYVAVQAATAALYVVLLILLLPRYQLPGATLVHAAHDGLLLACAVYFRADWHTPL